MIESRWPVADLVAAGANSRCVAGFTTRSTSSLTVVVTMERLSLDPWIDPVEVSRD